MRSLIAFRHVGRPWKLDFTTKRVWARLVIDFGPWRVIVR